MKIKNKKISELKPADYNPRQLKKHQYEAIKKSIEEFGLVDPIVINKNPERENIVIGGHQRLKVCKDLGYKEIPCVEIDLDLNKEKELNIRLNKNTGEFDFDLLANMFEESDLIEWGFEGWQLGVFTEDFNDLEERELDQNPLSKSMDTYIEGVVKQIVLYFNAEEFKEVMEKIENLKKEFKVENANEVFIKLIEYYEKSKN
tara:strand:- start:1116 stop:1721 length:606 start_codon:yes stop_codon:yes gene_type:complete